MIDFSVNITIVGAGVVGLAIAETLSYRFNKVLLIERHASVGTETSSRNSEVIHAGIYYPPGSLKARLCRTGNEAIYEICKARSIGHRRIGKLIVAATEEEIQDLEKMADQAAQNGIGDLSLLGREEISRRDPEVRAKAALFSPSTGILDSHALMRSFLVAARSQGATIAFRSEVTRIEFDGNRYILEINKGESRFETAVLINSAGLSADRIAKMAGIDIETAGYRLKYCKGSYFSASPAPKLTHLVYPVPAGDREGLGIHATLDLGGRVRFGPDAEYVKDIEYSVNENKRSAFCRSLRRWLPAVKPEFLQPDMSGIRPKLQGPGEAYRDFVIQDEEESGYAGLINLIGIESPGLTASIPIARYVLPLVEKIAGRTGFFSVP